MLTLLAWLVTRSKVRSRSRIMLWVSRCVSAQCSLNWLTPAAAAVCSSELVLTPLWTQDWSSCSWVSSPGCITHHHRRSQPTLSVYDSNIYSFNNNGFASVQPSWNIKISVSWSLDNMIWVLRVTGSTSQSQPLMIDINNQHCALLTVVSWVLTQCFNY